MAKSFKQKVRIKASAKEVFECLTDSRKHTAFTGAPAFCSKIEGREFSAYNGWVYGRNLEVKGNRLVQAWRGKDWAKGWYSIVTYEVKPVSKNECVIHFQHVGIPGALSKVKKGWNEHYWTPLREHFKALKKSKTTATKTRSKTKTRAKPKAKAKPKARTKARRTTTRRAA